MLEYDEIKKIRELFRNGKNIIEYLRNNKNQEMNSFETILYSYDLQAGNDISYLSDSIIRETGEQIGKRLIEIFTEFEPESILEAGIGEGVTLAHVVSSNLLDSVKFFGFDGSVSRALYAQKHLEKLNPTNLTLFTAEYGNIPLPDNSIDIVYTMQSIEPNHGKEQQILEELFRICRRYLISIEPSYELGTDQTKQWIEKNGYCRNLPNIIEKIGHKVLKHELLGLNFRSTNELALIIAKKNSQNSNNFNEPTFIFPISGLPLKKHPDCWYSVDDGYAFPIINEIPCLVKENGILASKLDNFT